ncbi:hypothetical protein E2C01_076266 [Portunus trituberculatus]|uniref:Uncharacterized protein n=1 Tax=Portunus trituberculatus TaxID=210409 RepID=A0A5B7ILK5_PORTR|nr:hypothetical protein [Portunus trituberculatus]
MRVARGPLRCVVTTIMVTTGRIKWTWRRLWAVNSRRRLPIPCTMLTARSCSLKLGKPVSSCSALDIGVK